MEERKRSEYRSSKRSRIMITGALVSLLERHSFEEITVTDIVKEADINRGTFYSHYKSTYDVVRKAEEAFAEEVLALFRDLDMNEFIKSPAALLENVSAFIENRRSFYETLIISDGGASFKAVLESGILECFEISGVKGEAALFVSAGISSAICKAVTGNNNIAATADIIQRIF